LGSAQWNSEESRGAGLRWRIKTITVTDLRDCVEGNGASVVFQMKDHDMTVRLTHRNQMEPVVELSLGSELRIFPLVEFTHFWLSMIEVGREADSAYLESLERLPPMIARKNSRRKVEETDAAPTIYAAE
jgi:hypothetical protein